MLALIVLRSSTPAPVLASSRLPQTMLWAWERVSDLRGADANTGIAFLAQTVTVDDGRVAIASRRWPLKVRPDAVLSAVTRVEMPAGRSLTGKEMARIADAIAATARFPQVAAVQLDFDATQSQRRMYRRLIEDVRGRIETRVPLSITALASWCVGGRWLDGLPIDEAVPMLFRLGPLNEPYRNLSLAPSLAHPLCRGSLGTSLDEPITAPIDGRRIYVFNPDSWTAERIEHAQNYARGKKGDR